MADQAELLPLLQATALGDQSAFRDLYQKTSPRLYSLCLQILKNKAWAEEVLQEAFVKIWHHACEYHQDRGQVSTWLTSIVRYRALDFLRAHKPTEDLEPETMNLASNLPGPLENVTLDKDLRALELCLDQLEEQQKQLIVMSFVEGLTHRQLMQRNPLPLGTIKSWIRRGLQSLRRCLQS